MANAINATTGTTVRLEIGRFIRIESRATVVWNVNNNCIWKRFRLTNANHLGARHVDFRHVTFNKDEQCMHDRQNLRKAYVFFVLMVRVMVGDMRVGFVKEFNPMKGIQSFEECYLVYCTLASAWTSKDNPASTNSGLTMILFASAHPDP